MLNLRMSTISLRVSSALLPIAYHGNKNRATQEQVAERMHNLVQKISPA